MPAGYNISAEAIAKCIELKLAGVAVREIAKQLQLPRPTVYGALKKSKTPIELNDHRKYNDAFLDRARELWASDLPTQTVLTMLGINRYALSNIMLRYKGFTPRVTTGNPNGRLTGPRMAPKTKGIALPMAVAPAYAMQERQPEDGECQFTSGKLNGKWQYCCEATGHKRQLYCEAHRQVVYEKPHVDGTHAAP